MPCKGNRNGGVVLELFGSRDASAALLSLVFLAESFCGISRYDRAKWAKDERMEPVYRACSQLGQRRGRDMDPRRAVAGPEPAILALCWSRKQQPEAMPVAVALG